MTIIIGFSKPKKFMLGAAAISMWMNRIYSHTYIRMHSDDMGDVVFHAAHGLVHFMTLENFVRNNDIVAEYKIEAKNSDQVWKSCASIAGIVYGYGELLTIFLADSVYAITKHHVKTYNGRGYICSELVGKVLSEACGIEFSKPLHLVKPSDIQKVMEDYCGAS